MADNVPGSENPEVEKVQNQIDATIDKIEKQEVKVEKADSPAEAQKETDVLNQLIQKFDALTGRLDAIDKRLAEPTVPAPAAKEEAPPETPKTDAPAEGASDEPEARPKKRRLGAWG